MGIWRFLSRTYRFIRSREADELRDHATIGGAIAAVFGVIEYVEKAHFSFNDLWSLNGLWLLLRLGGIAVITYLVAFVLLAAVEVALRRKITLADFGPVDGFWVYMTNEAGSEDYNRASVVRIWSSGLDFELDGFSYSREELTALEAKPDAEINPGHFRGRGTPRTGNSFHFHYRGWEARADEGIGYYEFYKGDDGARRIQGQFTGFQLGKGPEGSMQTRSLAGKKLVLAEEEEKIYTHDKAKPILLQLLREHKPKPCLLEDVGSVDGYWIDAIYKDAGTGQRELIEGSVVSIASSAARFLITGTTYRWDTANKEIVWLRKFRGTGHRMAAGNGIYYGSKVSGPEAQPLEGVGYYKFVQGNGGTQLVGAFLLGAGDQHRIVLGVPLSEADWAKDEGRERLRELLKNPPKMPWGT